MRSPPQCGSLTSSATYLGYCMDMWAKLGLGLWAVYWIWSGPQLGPSQQAQLCPTLDIVWMCGLNWVWVSRLFIGYGVGPNWAPSKQAQLGPSLDTVWMCGLNWVWVSWLFTRYGVGPNWALANKPSWAPLWILCGCVGKLGLGFWAVYWVWSGPQLGPSQQAQMGPTLDIVWMCGLNWVWIYGQFIGCGVGPSWAPSKPALLGPTLDTVWMCGLNWVCFFGCLLAMEWAPIGHQPTSPVGPHFGYCADTWVKLSLDVCAVYIV